MMAASASMGMKGGILILSGRSGSSVPRVTVCGLFSAVLQLVFSSLALSGVFLLIIALISAGVGSLSDSLREGSVLSSTFSD